MTRRPWRAALVAAIALGAVACGTFLGLGDYVDAPGDASAGSHGDDGGADATSTPQDDAAPEVATDSRIDAAQESEDAGPDGQGQADAGADASPGAEAGDAEPPTWTRVAFASTPQGACPAGFSSVPESVVFDPSTATPAANACACDLCSITTEPSCVTGTLTGNYDLNGAQTCTTNFSLSNSNGDGGGCNTDNPHVTLNNLDERWNPLPPTGGACAANPPTPHGDRVAFSNHAALCFTSADAGAPAVVAPFLDCVASAGSVPCPAGPLGVAHHVGIEATLSCSGACSCTVSATCQNGMVTYYKSSNCSEAGAGTTIVMPADGGCNHIGGGGSTYGSYLYTATLGAVTCNASGSTTATVTGLASEQTICCAQ